MSVAKKSKPGLWKQVVAEVKAGSKGGSPGQWSARKAQLAVQKYKSRGGGYKGPKEASNSLSKWGREDWATSKRIENLEAHLWVYVAWNNGYTI